MKARAARLLGDHPMRAWISTFHSLCVRLLRREAAAAGLPPEFLIYDEDDQLAAVREAMRALDVSEKLHPPRRLLVAHLGAQELGARARRTRTRFGLGPTERVMERYTAILRAAGALDFDDLLLRARDLLERDAGGARGLAAALPLRPRRRVPGHEPRPVRPRAPALGPRGQPDRRRRRGPVDLLLARRRHPEHPRLRARLPGRARLPPGGELPLAAERARRGCGARLAQPAPQGQDAAGRARRWRRGAAARGRWTSSPRPAGWSSARRLCARRVGWRS